jgi:hypothetical protein
MEEDAAFARERELTELQVDLKRKRSEVSNLVVGYRRAVEGTSPIPADPLRRNLVEARAELTALEQRLGELQRNASPEAQ